MMGGALHADVYIYQYSPLGAGGIKRALFSLAWKLIAERPARAT